MSDTRTVKEMADFLNALVAEGKGDAELLFDTEARTFHYHMARVGRAYYESEEIWGKAFVSLHEYDERYEDIGKDGNVTE